MAVLVAVVSVEEALQEDGKKEPMKQIYFTLLLLFFFSCNSKEETNSDFQFLPENKKQLIVADYASLLSKSEIYSLEQKIILYEKSTSKEIAVVTVDSIYPYRSIIKYAMDLGNFWGVGKEVSDNGLTFVISKFDSEAGIATGRSTEKILTDSICEIILNEKMVPEFKKGNFYKGLDVGLDEFFIQWKDE